MRNLPDGILGCFDFKKVLEAGPGLLMIDPRYVCSDWLHSRVYPRRARCRCRGSATVRLGARSRNSAQPQQAAKVAMATTCAAVTE